MNTQLLHEQVWTRFIRMPYGHLLDYADKNGHTVIPTAAECQAALPNTHAWGTSIENGAFFGGLYLFSLCERFECVPDDTLKKEMKTLADGLLILCDVCRVDGCIARGVADDGQSHPPFSSEDQFGPWLLGLWRYSQSAASEESMREKIRLRLVRAIRGVRATGWNIPSEWDGVTGGALARRDWRGASKLLFTAALGRELGILDTTEYEKIVTAHPENGIYTRYEIVSHGFAPDMIRSTNLIQFWIDICAHLCVRELITLDVPRAEYYRAGLAANSTVAVEFCRDYEAYIAEPRKPICFDWRVLLKDVHPWKNVPEAAAEAGRQLGVFFHQYSPGMGDEKRILAQGLFSCWIAVSGGDPIAADYAYSCLDNASEKVNWAECGYSFAFAAEGAIYCYQNREKYL